MRIVKQKYVIEIEITQIEIDNNKLPRPSEEQLKKYLQKKYKITNIRLIGYDLTDKNNLYD